MPMKRIPVVNNDFETMTLLKSWLEKKTYKVKYTGNRQDVPKMIKEFRPGLVIVDVLQREVLEQLKIRKETRSVPVLLMTGYSSRQINTPLPVDDTIEKPFNLPLLEKKIERLMQRIS